MQISARDLGLSLGQRRVLEHIHLDISPASSWAVTGPSGRGKTCLLHILAGLLRPSSGQLLWDGQDVFASSRRHRDRQRQQRIGMVFQRSYLHPRLSLRDNLLLPATFTAIPCDQQRLAELTEACGLTGCLDLLADSLSGGQVVRCCVLRALLHAPAVLIADEPTAMLDDAHAKAMGELLLRMQRQEGFTLIIATHDLRLARICSQQVELGPC